MATKGRARQKGTLLHAANNKIEKLHCSSLSFIAAIILLSTLLADEPLIGSEC